MAGMSVTHTGLPRALGLDTPVLPSFEVSVGGGITSQPRLRLF